jgi:4-hydroxy-tetrahydrodipicolinate synthase
MALGGDGIISVVSNATPRLMSQLCNAMRAGKVEEAREIHFRLLPWMRAAFVESNPIPAKAGLSMMGRMQNVVRLPLVTITDDAAAKVRAALIATGALT